MNVKAVQAIVDGAAEVLDRGLVGIEAIAIFIIDMYRSLFLCLMNLAIHGSLDLLIASVLLIVLLVDLSLTSLGSSGTKEAQLFVTTAFQGARLDIQRAVAGINTGLANSVRTIERIPGYAFRFPSIYKTDCSFQCRHRYTPDRSTIPRLAQERHHPFLGPPVPHRTQLFDSNSRLSSRNAQSSHLRTNRTPPDRSSIIPRQLHDQHRRSAPARQTECAVLRSRIGSRLHRRNWSASVQVR